MGKVQGEGGSVEGDEGDRIATEIEQRAIRIAKSMGFPPREVERDAWWQMPGSKVKLCTSDAAHVSMCDVEESWPDLPSLLFDPSVEGAALVTPGAAEAAEAAVRGAVNALDLWRLAASHVHRAPSRRIAEQLAFMALTFADAARVNAERSRDLGAPSKDAERRAHFVWLQAAFWPATAAMALMNNVEMAARARASHVTALQIIDIARRRVPPVPPMPSGRGALAETWRRIAGAVPDPGDPIGWRAAAGLGFLEAVYVLGIVQHGPRGTASFSSAHESLIRAVRPGAQDFGDHVAGEAIRALGHDARRYGQGARQKVTRAHKAKRTPKRGG